MGAISKHVLSDGEWCAPTRELQSSKLLQLVHQTRNIITEAGQPDTDVEPHDDVVLLVNKKPSDLAIPVERMPSVAGELVTELDDDVPVEIVEAESPVEPVAPAPRAASVNGSASQYPAYRDSLRPVRLVLTLLLSLAAVTGVLFVLLVR